MKKILSIVLAVALVLALAVPAFAVEIPNSEVIASFEGPKIATNWWYDAWLDADQKVELANAMYSGTANYIVVVFEGVGADGTDIGYQIGIQDNTSDWLGYLFHVNYPDEPSAANNGVPVAKADKIEVIDGNSYVYLSVEALLNTLAENGHDYSDGTGFGWIIGAPGENPLLGMYAVKAEVAVEEPVEDTTVEEPVEDTTVVETPAEDEPADTGLALAVVPMIVAMAAIVASKRR